MEDVGDKCGEWVPPEPQGSLPSVVMIVFRFPVQKKLRQTRCGPIPWESPREVSMTQSR